VRDHAVEAAQPVLALADLRLVLAQVLRRGGLLDERDRAEEPVRALQQLGARARLVDRVDDLR
jgi:hypothetical protein